MAEITREILLNIAYLSRLELSDQDVPELQKQVGDVLNYAQRVTQIAKAVDIATNKNINVFREDVVDTTDYEPILAQAPEREEDFFVVPRIIEQE